MIKVVRLSPGVRAQYLEFFDQRAFTDNPGWSFCFCNCFYADHCEKPWKMRTADENRFAVSERISRDEMGGYLAFDGATAIGWCGAAPKSVIPVFAADTDPQKSIIGAMTFFLVAPQWRRRGISRMLLQAACADFAEQGLKIAEAYPRPNAATDAEQHFGPLTLFLSEGFTHYKDDPDDGSVLVRKSLPVE